MTTTQPRGALIEIIERAQSPDHVRDVERVGIIRPSEIRVNGVPLLCPKDDPVEVHAISLGDTPTDDALLRVTLTCWARRIVMGVRDVSQEVDVDTLRRHLASGYWDHDDPRLLNALTAALDHMGQPGIDAVAQFLEFDPKEV